MKRETQLDGWAVERVRVFRVFVYVYAKYVSIHVTTALPRAGTALVSIAEPTLGLAKP